MKLAGYAHLAATNIELTVRPAQESIQEKRVLEKSQGDCHMKAVGRGGAKGEDGRRDSKEHEKDPRNRVIKHSSASMANSDSATNKFS